MYHAGGLKAGQVLDVDALALPERGVSWHRRGDLHDGCRPEAVAHFLVASLEGAILLTKLTKDIAVMEQCVTEMNRYLSLYELGA